ncbi:XRE family transcriptional regulator [Mycolicibacterium psychrotolerans]|uniref:HTH cro/C1-type domain-containing protein n=1 Tax=Mycolicibacterium psychrotolerans TaxID=216929 RepID=A0A7I7MD25_9MYCO|nr:XRE family transcriptional regulator [Mycolicibacterium psychrotolerans]BBX69740.1 hypothetical protein MPSYJ_32010 [Mycolicibacterium psychrotolerans]
MAEGQDKAGRRLNATGETVQANIRRIRDDVLRIPVTELSRRLEELGRPIPPLGLRRIEDGTRRVDVDDLVSIAVALEVSPITLLIPDSEDRGEQVVVTGGGEHTSEEVWKWLRAERPLADVGDASGLLNWAAATFPSWRRVEYLEGALALIELGQVESEMKAGGERADAARQKLADMYREYGLGDD